MSATLAKEIASRFFQLPQMQRSQKRLEAIIVLVLLKKKGTT